MKVIVMCEEIVNTEFIVEAPNMSRAQEWLEEKGADAVSTLTQRQQVRHREWSTSLRLPELKDAEVDFNTEEE